ncbi:hypothetical protein [Chryseolinea lacunae]|uniref:Uncharacterized protein n=1 Tax=Chryseolinea lacunae TaxID=2801331 RepID=A0ABS1L1P7_9BACT|nr:hypothetical protein [Chryseolinea lacunae]MBL0745614.1 hypothetical protein [Chryseolinea lacunae]
MVTSFGETIVMRIEADVQCVAKTIDQLHAQGYDSIFELIGEKLRCLQTGDYYLPRDLRVDEIFRVEKGVLGYDEFYIYALSEPFANLKGIFYCAPNSD